MPANNRTYGYQDFQYFLTSGIGAWGNLAWTYDKIGNRLTETRGALTDTYTYQPNGAGGRTAVLQQITLGVGGTRDYVHGPAGHLELVTADAKQVDFTTDAAGRLSRLERAAGDAAADFRYDGRSFLASSQADTVSLFADGFEAGDTRCWSETVGAPNAPVNCSPQPETFPAYSSEGLLHGLHRNPGQADETRRSTFYFAGQPLAELDRTPAGAETWRWMTTDHLGTPVLATSSGGTELWRGGFEPFGQDVGGASMAGVDLRFPGQWTDETWVSASLGVGLVYNVHRWYSPSLGRYERPDPFDGTSGAFPYVANNPLRFVDALGLVRKDANCKGCSCSEAAAEVRSMEQVAQRNSGRYRKKLLDITFGCGDSAHRLIEDLETQVRPRCWVLSDQLLADSGLFGLGNLLNDITQPVLGVNTAVHFVVKLSPCGSLNPLDELYLDGYYEDAPRARPLQVENRLEVISDSRRGPRCPVGPRRGPGFGGP